MILDTILNQGNVAASLSKLYIDPDQTQNVVADYGLLFRRALLSLCSYFSENVLLSLLFYKKMEKYM